MEAKRKVERSSAKIGSLKRKRTCKQRTFDYRQGMVMRVILGPPRAKERLLHRNRLPEIK